VQDAVISSDNILSALPRLLQQRDGAVMTVCQQAPAELVVHLS